MCNFGWFENKVLESFSELKIELNNKLRIGAAVSGGADSVSLLISLHNLSLKFGFYLKVITVNHFIRNDEETCGDADFVLDLCKKKGIECTLAELKKGAVSQLADSLKCGIEDGARILRYKEFESFIKENQLDYLCLAHNLNDQKETVLMRFLQGSGVEGLRGIPFLREKYFRPLLNISRADIERYLGEQEISFRIDSTNSDTLYFRNRVRSVLVPELNHSFSDWDKGVITCAEKAGEDEEFFEELIQDYFKENLCFYESENSLSMDLTSLKLQKKAVLRRIILKACNKISENNRIPYTFVKELENWIYTKNTGNDSCKSFGDLLFFIKKDKLFIKNNVKQIKEIHFSAIIERSGEYKVPAGIFFIEQKGENLHLQFQNQSYEIKASLPVCIRNFWPGDFTINKDGSKKKVVDVLSSWQISESDKKYVPVLQSLNSENQEILCIFAKFLGFYDWIV